MSRTKKPCPACGVVDYRREADKICVACERLIADGKTFREQAAKAVKQKVLAAYSIPVWHWLPYIHHGYVRGQSPEASQEFQKIFLELVAALSSPSRADGHVHDCRTDHLIKGQQGGNHIAMLDPAIVAILGRLYQAADAMTQAGYTNGFNEGNDMLGRMVTGELSIDAINKLSIGRTFQPETPTTKRKK